MKIILSLFTCLILSFSGFSQFWITGVSSSPLPANDCDNLSITITGNLPASNCTYTTSTVISGNMITIDVDVSCGGIGIPVITTYTETVVLGTLTSSVYTLLVNQYSAGSLQESNYTTLYIGSCCPSVAAINTTNSSICIGDAISFIDLGTMSDSLIWTDNGNVFFPNPSALGWIYSFSSTGIHNVTLTAVDTSGCSDTSNVVFTINDLPEISMSSIDATCGTCANGEALVTVVSGPFPHQFVWSIGGITNPLVGLNPGVYSVSFTDGNTCSNTDTVTVNNSVNDVVFDEFNFGIFPNPAKDFLIFKFSEANQLNFKYNIYDSFGRLIYKSYLENIYSKTYKVNLNLSKGVYFLEIDDVIKKLFIE